MWQMSTLLLRKLEMHLLVLLSGIIASIMYNRFSHVKLPDALAFFSGKRLVPIMTSVSMLASFSCFIFYMAG